MTFRVTCTGLIAALAVSAIGCSSGNAVDAQSPRRTRTADGKPDLSGIWQANNEAHWDLQAHGARAGMVMQQGVYPYDYAQVPAAAVVSCPARANPRSRWAMAVTYRPGAAASSGIAAAVCRARSPGSPTMAAVTAWLR